MAYCGATPPEFGYLIWALGARGPRCPAVTNLHQFRQSSSATKRVQKPFLHARVENNLVAILMVLHSAHSQPPALRRPECGLQVGYLLTGFWLQQVTSETGGSMLLQGFIEVSEKHCSPIQLSTFKNEMLLWSSFHGSFRACQRPRALLTALFPDSNPSLYPIFGGRARFQGLSMMVCRDFYSKNA